VRLVLGITSPPHRRGAKQREGIRQTWFRYPGMGRTVVACFVIGRNGTKERDRARMDQEARIKGDLIFLPHVRDGDGPFVTISKLHAWFRLACELLGLISRGDPLRSNSPRAVLGGYGAALTHGVRHIAKVDDDTFLNLPVLTRELDSLHCWRSLYFGNLAFAGYNPVSFLKCGFDYSAKGGRYRRYACWNESNPHGAAHPPFPWTSGALMLASTPLVVRIAAAPEIGEFVERSKLNHARLGRVSSTDEDVAMGFYISRFHRARLANVTYVRVNERLTNLGCGRNSGLYKPPKNRSVGIHFVKNAGGMAYVWSLLVHGMPHNKTRCREMTGDGRL
jgi:hypothetical protein